MASNRVRIAIAVVVGVISIAFILFRDTEPERPTVGSCIGETDNGIEVVECDSAEADYRLVSAEGITLDMSEPECPEGTELIGLRDQEEGYTFRWCAEPV